ncbi:MAG: DNA repair protein RecN [Flavobacteriaceae bacterium]|jgi:DNA repair protein RecN (Recombination protein N)|nr:DNA repair protein RecN [Flavobacteriaceae bacterium]
MLTHLSIRNYALIDNLNMDLPAGMITITGETGAGKSIILGALKLVLGERADLKSLKNPQEKCFVEAEFKLSSSLFSEFFIQNELDFDENTLIRREILPSGKSRAFINDSPVTLDILQNLSGQLIDIHSQFETSELVNEKFQLNLLDSFSGISPDLDIYKTVFIQYISDKKKLHSLKEKLQSGTQEQEYKNYLLEELERADLDTIRFSDLEEEMNLMKNSEYLLQILSETKQILSDEELGILSQIQEIHSRMDKGGRFSSELEKLSERIGSIKLELQDISSESDFLMEKLDFNPSRFEELTQKINLLNSLFQKHKVADTEALKEIRNTLAKETSNISNLETLILNSEINIQKLSAQLTQYAQELHNQRALNIQVLENKILDILTRLGMEKTRIKIEIHETGDFTSTGTDRISVLFSANAGINIQPLAKAISGGERSRFMLAIKKIMAETEDLPTLILDEIDAGVSGRIANEMGKLMQEMSKTMQVIVITHLPQVAAKGNSQFKVEKAESKGETITQVRLLTHEERIEEIAQLLSGSNITETARQQARELFK